MLRFGKEAKLQLIIQSQATAAQVLNIRGITRSGVISFIHTTQTNNQRNSTVFPIDDIPLFITVTPTATTTNHGAVWASLNLRVNDDIVFGLMSGFVNDDKALSWPNSDMQPKIPGHGFFTFMNSANPAAGAQANISPQSNQFFKILHGSVTLVTDANAANRRLHLTITTAGGGTVELISSQDQVASTTRIYTFAQYPSMPDDIDDNDILIPLPNELWSDGEGTIDTSIVNGQATDNLGVLSLMVERFYT